jgi:hypothetical protein
MDLGAFLQTVEITLPSLAGFSPPGQNALGKAMVQRMLLSDDNKSTDDVERMAEIDKRVKHDMTRHGMRRTHTIFSCLFCCCTLVSCCLSVSNWWGRGGTSLAMAMKLVLVSIPCNLAHTVGTLLNLIPRNLRTHCRHTLSVVLERVHGDDCDAWRPSLPGNDHEDEEHRKGAH